MKEYLTALLLMSVPRSSYTHWMTCPSRARTLSIPVMVAVCSVLATTVYTVPGKAVARTSPLSTVPLCIHSGAEPVSLCLQMRVSWSEQSPWSSRETVKAAVRCSNKGAEYIDGHHLICVCTYVPIEHNALHGI